MKLSFLFVSVATMACLAACGGGGGDATPASAADKYVGTWTNCVVTPASAANAASSTRDLVTFNKNSTGGLDITDVYTYYTNDKCAGTGMPEPTVTGNIIFTGTKTIGSDTVDKVTLTVTAPRAQTKKDILLVKNGILNNGNTDLAALLDTEGYPDTMNAAPALVKQ
jgi:hypothetical protein